MAIYCKSSKFVMKTLNLTIGYNATFVHHANYIVKSTYACRLKYRLELSIPVADHDKEVMLRDFIVL